VYEQRKFQRGQIQSSEHEIIYNMCHDPVRITTPFPSVSPLVKDATLKGLTGALTKVPIAQARIVEAWMSSIDAYFKLKQTEKTTGYLPYVFKLGFLTPSPVGNFETGSDSYWSLRSLLQFITGCRSRPLPEGVFDAAREWLKDYNEEEEINHSEVSKAIPLSDGERKAIENCVFQHKSILVSVLFHEPKLSTYHYRICQQILILFALIFAVLIAAAVSIYHVLDRKQNDSRHCTT
jgi:hypothetical protein